MTISNQQMLERMNKEVQEAMTKHGDTSRMREHVRAVKMLCDLLLDAEEGAPSEKSVSGTTGSDTEPTAAEIRKMMGGDPPSSKKKKEDPYDDDANGSSLLDF